MGKWDKRERDLDKKRKGAYDPRDSDDDRFFKELTPEEKEEERIRHELAELDAAQMKNNYKKLFSDGLMERSQFNDENPDVMKKYNRKKKSSKPKPKRKPVKKIVKKCRCK
jgi:hypothetical protein